MHAEVIGEEVHELVALAQPQQPGIDEHADQLVAERLVQQRRHHGGIHATRQAEQHAGRGPPACARVAMSRAMMLPGCQSLGTAADVVHEARQDPLALGRVRHLGMELHAVEAPALVGHAGERRVAAAGNGAKAGRQPRDPVAVAHPDVERPVGRRRASRRRDRAATGHRQPASPARSRIPGGRKLPPRRRAGPPWSACRSRCRARARRARTRPRARAADSAPSITDSGPPDRITPSGAEGAYRRRRPRPRA